MWTQALCRLFFFRFFPFFLHGPFGHINCSGAGTRVLQPCGRPVVNETGVGTFHMSFLAPAKAPSMMCYGRSVGGCEAQKCDRRVKKRFVTFFSFPICRRDFAVHML